MKRTVWFHSDPLDLPAETFISRAADYERPQLRRVVELLQTGGTVPPELGRSEGGESWTIPVHGLGGDVRTVSCFVMDEIEPRQSRAAVGDVQATFADLHVRVPVDRYIPADEFLEDVPRSEDRTRLRTIFTRILRGESVDPSTAREVGRGEWDVRFEVKFAGATTIRVVLVTTDPRDGRA